MGVEWDIGCTKCKHFVWLGSQKPYKWEGFQVPHEVISRFLGLHAGCSGAEGNFLLTNDASDVAPWDEDNSNANWMEDILSRSFVYDSYPRNGFKCANCHTLLHSDESVRIEENLKKSAFLWFCDESCFRDYIDNRTESGRKPIYDSTDDVIQSGPLGVLEIGCTRCKTFTRIDFTKDPEGIIKDFEYLAEFMIEHITYEYGNHPIQISFGEHAPWIHASSRHDWSEYKN